MRLFPKSFFLLIYVRPLSGGGATLQYTWNKMSCLSGRTIKYVIWDKAYTYLVLRYSLREAAKEKKLMALPLRGGGGGGLNGTAIKKRTYLQLPYQDVCHLDPNSATQLLLKF